MTVHHTRDALGAPAVPRPRAPDHDTVEEQDPGVDRTPAVERGTLGEFPWPEPWHFSRGTHPRSEYWNATTAGWHSRGPVPPPRQR
jgi:hypothetical protein